MTDAPVPPDSYFQECQVPYLHAGLRCLARFTEGTLHASQEWRGVEGQKEALASDSGPVFYWHN